MASWPSTLPAPQADGYSVAPVSPVIRTDMESGAARVRRRTKARNDKVSASWDLTDAQMATFRSWFDSDSGAAGGAAWFTINLALGTGGVVSVEARMSQGYKHATNGPLSWSLSAEMEVR